MATAVNFLKQHHVNTSRTRSLSYYVSMHQIATSSQLTSSHIVSHTPAFVPNSSYICPNSSSLRPFLGHPLLVLWLVSRSKWNLSLKLLLVIQYLAVYPHKEVQENVTLRRLTLVWLILNFLKEEKFLSSCNFFNPIKNLFLGCLHMMPFKWYNILILIISALW